MIFKLKGFDTCLFKLTYIFLYTCTTLIYDGQIIILFSLFTFRIDSRVERKEFNLDSGKVLANSSYRLLKLKLFNLNPKLGQNFNLKEQVINTIYFFSKLA